MTTLRFRSQWVIASRPDLNSKQLVALHCGELFFVERQRFGADLQVTEPVQTSCRFRRPGAPICYNSLCAWRLASSNLVATFAAIDWSRGAVVSHSSRAEKEHCGESKWVFSKIGAGYSKTPQSNDQCCRDQI